MRCLSSKAPLLLPTMHRSFSSKSSLYLLFIVDKIASKYIMYVKRSSFNLTTLIFSSAHQLGKKRYFGFLVEDVHFLFQFINIGMLYLYLGRRISSTYSVAITKLIRFYYCDLKKSYQYNLRFHIYIKKKINK